MNVSLEQIPTTAKSLAKTLQGGEVVGLIGDLGSGKTTFTQELAKYLNIKRRVTSPTFTLHSSFEGILPKNKKSITLHHLDVYRLNQAADITSLGISEFITKTDTITVIEWADRIKQFLPKETIYIHFE